MRARVLRRNPRRRRVEPGIEFAGFFPAHHVERFDELADAVSLGAEQAKLDDLFVGEVLGEIGINLVFVNGVFALFEQVGVMQRRLFTRGEVLAAGIIEQIVDHGLGQSFGLGDVRAHGRAIAALMRD